MFMELSKARNKSTVDLAVVRRKYKLDEEQQVPEASVAETQQFIEIIEAYDDEPKAESPKQRRAVVVSRSKPSPLNAIKLESIEEIPKISVKPLKILNPTIHSKITNVNRKERFSCDKCSHTTSTKLSIERHMQLHLQPSSNLFSCSTCQKTFAKRNILKAHEKIHLIQRPTFDCPQCDKTLSSKTAVANHIRWLHKVKREFECEKCHNMFATVRKLLSASEESNLIYFREDRWRSTRRLTRPSKLTAVPIAIKDTRLPAPSLSTWTRTMTLNTIAACARCGWTQEELWSNTCCSTATSLGFLVSSAVRSSSERKHTKSISYQCTQTSRLTRATGALWHFRTEPTVESTRKLLIRKSLPKLTRKIVKKL